MFSFKKYFRKIKFAQKILLNFAQKKLAKIILAKKNRAKKIVKNKFAKQNKIRENLAQTKLPK